MFVKGETLENDVPKQDEPSTNDVKQKETEPAVETSEDEEAKREEQARKERQEEANARFQALLGRGRGDDKSKRSMFRDEQKPSGGDSSLNGPVGLGFAPASKVIQKMSRILNHRYLLALECLHSLVAAEMGHNKRQKTLSPVRVEFRSGKVGKAHQGNRNEAIAKMGYKGSGGLGAKRLRKNETDDNEKPVAARTGRSRPVEVVVDTSQLGYGGFKEATKLKVNQQIEAEVRGVELPKEKKEPKDEEMRCRARHCQAQANSSTAVMEERCTTVV